LTGCRNPVVLKSRLAPPPPTRAIRTLRVWDVIVAETFFMGVVAKSQVLAAFKPHMFFDDQMSHCERASPLVPTGRVPVKNEGGCGQIM
jgi:5'-nucleotidase